MENPTGAAKPFAITTTTTCCATQANRAVAVSGHLAAAMDVAVFDIIDLVSPYNDR